MSEVLSNATLKNYLKRLAAIDKAAAREMMAWIDRNGLADTDALIRRAYGLATRYGEASTGLVAEMYDAIAALSSRAIPAAAPAATATLAETAEAINGIIEFKNPKLVGNQVSRLVKMAGQDTMIQNAERDGAEWAWVSIGDTCAFCQVLASRGWQPASKKALKGKHANHIHANCDCSYMIRFSENEWADYTPPIDELDWRDLGGDVNIIRRQLYAENRDEINAQKRAAYRARVDRQNADTQD